MVFSNNTQRDAKMTVNMLRLTTGTKKLAISRSTFYLQISQGLITKPIQIGLRAVGWPSYELDAILNARIAGKSNDEIKTLVTELEKQRTQKVRA